MEFKLLEGRVEDEQGKQLRLTPQQFSAVVALAVTDGRAVPAARLTELLWDDAGDRGRSGNLKSLITNLRGVLGADRVVHENGGYRLVVHNYDFVDLLAFRAVVTRAEELTQTDPHTAAALYSHAALEMWDGMPLPNLAATTAMDAMSARLVNEMTYAVERMAAALLAVGRYQELTLVLPELIDRYPHRENLVKSLMWALYMAGRKEEALHVFKRRDEAAHETTGVGPGPVLTRLNEQIEKNDPALELEPAPMLPGDQEMFALGFTDPTPYPGAMTNYMAAGSDNRFIDRAATLIVLAVAPEVAKLSVEGNEVVARMVAHLAGLGCTQYLDIGGPIPSVRTSLHRVLSIAAPGSKVVHATGKPALVELFNRRLANVEGAVAVQGDLTTPDAIFDHPSTRSMLDLSQPVALVCQDEANYTPDARERLRDIMRRLAPGSYLVLTSSTIDGMTSLVRAQLNRIYSDPDAPQLILRTREECEAMHDGMEMVVPMAFYTEVLQVQESPPRLGQFRAYAAVSRKA
ncbi:hypothetical protein GCM10022221_68510 [Actinocorallia aurea]